MADARQASKVTSSDLETPVLKKPVVTTGRGGTGNMAKNDDPHETRLRQDVEGCVLGTPIRLPATKPTADNSIVPRWFSAGAQHAGRGGAGNVFRDVDEAGADPADPPSRGQAVVDDDDGGPEPLAAKGKSWLFGKKA